MNLHGSHGRTNGAVGLQGHTAFGAGFHDGHGLAPVGGGLAGAVALQIEGAGIAQRQQAAAGHLHPDGLPHSGLEHAVLVGVAQADVAQLAGAQHGFLRLGPQLGGRAGGGQRTAAGLLPRCVVGHSLQRTGLVRTAEAEQACLNA